ncbi:MAG: 50S ribosomal protein L19 [Tissierellia bacterium]|jgi:large subunit ribosomal protein L19|nr:50S ribosomal protein L19 [Tissierellia bacterium]
MDIINMLEQEQLKEEITQFRVGDTIRVNYRIIEGSRERVQAFEGIVLKIQGSGVKTTFTVRRISYGVGVERTFLLHSPRIAGIDLVRMGRVRRAKLFYLRDRVGKSARVKERKSF